MVFVLFMVLVVLFLALIVVVMLVVLIVLMVLWFWYSLVRVAMCYQQAITSRRSCPCPPV